MSLKQLTRQRPSTFLEKLYTAALLSRRRSVFRTPVSRKVPPDVPVRLGHKSRFRLTDQLYEVAEIVAGANGVNLSIIYDQILNNLLPIFQDTRIGKQQNEIRRWSLKEIKISPWIQKLLEAQHRSSVGGPGITPMVGASSALEGRFAMQTRSRKWTQSTDWS